MAEPRPEKIIDRVRRHIDRRKKPKGPTARRRAAKRRKGKAGEFKAMTKARLRDDYCRFPMCGCRRQSGPWVPFLKAKTEVVHQRHRGMGGNPDGDRTVTGLLLLLCNWRHKLSKFSIDRHGIRWEALTEQGADGPIRWWIHRKTLPLRLWPDDGICSLDMEWIVLAEEIAPHELAPILHPAQSEILAWLAEMSV